MMAVKQRMIHGCTVGDRAAGTLTDLTQNAFSFAAFLAPLSSPALAMLS